MALPPQLEEVLKQLSGEINKKKKGNNFEGRFFEVVTKPLSFPKLKDGDGDIKTEYEALASAIGVGKKPKEETPADYKERLFEAFKSYFDISGTAPNFVVGIKQNHPEFFDDSKDPDLEKFNKTQQGWLRDTVLKTAKEGKTKKLAEVDPISFAKAIRDLKTKDSPSTEGEYVNPGTLSLSDRDVIGLVDYALTKLPVNEAQKSLRSSLSQKKEVSAKEILKTKRHETQRTIDAIKARIEGINVSNLGESDPLRLEIEDLQKILNQENALFLLNKKMRKLSDLTNHTQNESMWFEKPQGPFHKNLTNRVGSRAIRLRRDFPDQEDRIGAHLMFEEIDLLITEIADTTTSSTTRSDLLAIMREYAKETNGRGTKLGSGYILPYGLGSLDEPHKTEAGALVKNAKKLSDECSKYTDRLQVVQRETLTALISLSLFPGTESFGKNLCLKTSASEPRASLNRIKDLLQIKEGSDDDKSFEETISNHDGDLIRRTDLLSNLSLTIIRKLGPEFSTCLAKIKDDSRLMEALRLDRAFLEHRTVKEMLTQSIDDVELDQARREYENAKSEAVASFNEFRANAYLAILKKESLRSSSYDVLEVFDFYENLEEEDVVDLSNFYSEVTAENLGEALNKRFPKLPKGKIYEGENAEIDRSAHIKCDKLGEELRTLKAKIDKQLEDAKKTDSVRHALDMIRQAELERGFRALQTAKLQKIGDQIMQLASDKIEDGNTDEISNAEAILTHIITQIAYGEDCNTLIYGSEESAQIGENDPLRISGHKDLIEQAIADQREVDQKRQELTRTLDPLSPRDNFSPKKESTKREQNRSEIQAEIDEIASQISQREKNLKESLASTIQARVASEEDERSLENLDLILREVGGETANSFKIRRNPDEDFNLECEDDRDFCEDNKEFRVEQIEIAKLKFRLEELTSTRDNPELSSSYSKLKTTISGLEQEKTYLALSLQEAERLVLEKESKINELQEQLAQLKTEREELPETEESLESGKDVNILNLEQQIRALGIELNSHRERQEQIRHNLDSMDESIFLAQSQHFKEMDLVRLEQDLFGELVNLCKTTHTQHQEKSKDYATDVQNAINGTEENRGILDYIIAATLSPIVDREVKDDLNMIIRELEEINQIYSEYEDSSTEEKKGKYQSYIEKITNPRVRKIINEGISYKVALQEAIERLPLDQEATKIQAAYRGYISRKNNKRKGATNQEDENATTVISSLKDDDSSLDLESEYGDEDSTVDEKYEGPSKDEYLRIAIKKMKLQTMGRLDLNKSDFNGESVTLGKEEIEKLFSGYGLKPIELHNSRFGGLTFDFTDVSEEAVSNFLRNAHVANFRNCTFRNLNIREMENPKIIIEKFPTAQFRRCSFEGCDFGDQIKFKRKNIDETTGIPDENIVPNPNLAAREALKAVSSSRRSSRSSN